MHLLIPTVTLSGSITNTRVVIKKNRKKERKKHPEANIQAFLVRYEWMAGSSNGLAYINATYSHQNATSFQTQSARNHPFQPRAVSIETPVNRPVSPADLCTASIQGCLHFSSLWKRNILWRLSDGLRVRKNGSLTSQGSDF